MYIQYKILILHNMAKKNIIITAYIEKILIANCTSTSNIVNVRYIVQIVHLYVHFRAVLAAYVLRPVARNG